MSLTYVTLAGAAGGVLSTFTSWLVTGSLFHPYQRLTPDTWRPEGPRQYTLSSLLQVVEGAVVGVLFFVTGGPSAVAAANWVVRGLVFGGLGWLALACPVILGMAIYVRLHRGVVIGLLLDSLLAVLLMSVASAWAAR